jgi:hypothetical protein
MIESIIIIKTTCLYRGSTSRYEEESPPPRNAGRQQKPAGGGYGYGEYDHLYKNAPVCFFLNYNKIRFYGFYNI